MYPGTEEAKELIAELCRLFYDQGWVSGTGGGISIRTSDDTIAMAPSGVQKERMRPQDMFMLDMQGNVAREPEARPPPYKPPKLSECSPLFMLAYEHRDAGAVMHSHSANAVLATMLDPAASTFACTHLEMIKGIAGHGYYDSCEVPIIENTARECELTERMRAAMLAHPRATAVLVRRHGVYVWGNTWIEAKTQAECYDYLFGIAVRMAHLGIDAREPPAPLPLQPRALLTGSDATTGGTNGSTAADTHGLSGKHDLNGKTGVYQRLCRSCAKQVLPLHTYRCYTIPSDTALEWTASARCVENLSKRARHNGSLQPSRSHPKFIVLDIEGTTTPIDFVAKTLFPYASEHVEDFLQRTRDNSATQSAMAALLSCSEAQGFPAQHHDEIARTVQVVQALTKADKKVTALKHLQGLIWNEAYSSGAIKGQLFSDVPDALQQWRDAGIKTYIYSSGSRQAQRDLFGHTTVGDLRPYLQGYFDTSTGAKTDASSYQDIAQSIGAGAPCEIMFATDIVAEAQAASAAGWRTALVVRPGNNVLPEGHAFPVVQSMGSVLSVYAKSA